MALRGDAKPQNSGGAGGADCRLHVKRAIGLIYGGFRFMWRVKAHLQLPRRSRHEHRGEVMHGGNREEDFAEIGDGDGARWPEPGYIAGPVSHALQAAQWRSAGAWARHKAGKIAGAIADERHAGAVESRKDHLTRLAYAKRFAGLRRDDLEVEIGFAQMVAGVREAIDTAAKSHFGRSVVFVNLAAGGAANPLCQTLWDVIAA